MAVHIVKNAYCGTIKGIKINRVLQVAYDYEILQLVSTGSTSSGKNNKLKTKKKIIS